MFVQGDDQGECKREYIRWFEVNTASSDPNLAVGAALPCRLVC